MSWPDRPAIHEVNAWVWVHDWSHRIAATLDLGSMPAEAWDEVCRPGVDAVWLMGVWERSPAGVEIGRSDPNLDAAHHQALPDFAPEDVAGSPYCVRRYEVDAALGGRAALARAREELARRNCALVLDFVPNHVAPDHPWTAEHPDVFVTGTAGDLADHPDAYLRVGDHVLARGRDPYFPPWPDVVQLDAFSPGLRRAATETLVDITGQCDGVRCDMAMLLMNDVFGRTWGGEPPSEDYWPQV
ncbi:MAG: alpha-amylase, partial [Acidimicrobiales bacterium]